MVNISPELGLFYDEGKHIPQDLPKAYQLFTFECFTQTAKQNLEAINSLGKHLTSLLVLYCLAGLYFRGAGVHKDDNKAFKLWDQAASANHLPAVDNLGFKTVEILKKQNRIILKQRKREIHQPCFI